MVLLFPSLALSGEVTMDDLVIRDGLYYKKFTTIPFTGKITGKSQGTFRNGKKHGLWIVFWSNGQLRSKDTFKNGKRDGPWDRYHDTGQLESKGTYKDGKPYGPWVAYNYDGTVNEVWTGTYKDGEKISD